MPQQGPEAQFRFLISCVRHSNNGKIDFDKVAAECDVISKGAAAKRYERMMKANGINHTAPSIRDAPTASRPRKKKCSPDPTSVQSTKKRKLAKSDGSDNSFKEKNEDLNVKIEKDLAKNSDPEFSNAISVGPTNSWYHEVAVQQTYDLQTLDGFTEYINSGDFEHGSNDHNVLQTSAFKYPYANVKEESSYVNLYDLGSSQPTANYPYVNIKKEKTYTSLYDGMNEDTGKFTQMSAFNTDHCANGHMEELSLFGDREMKVKSEGENREAGSILIAD